jgi:hypothetical protein
MGQYNRFSARASLAVVGAYMRQLKIWETVAEQVEIRQKQVKYLPLDKLLDAFINILAGGQGMIEVNTRVRSDPGLQQAFGRTGCADQSTISQTLNACDTRTVEQMRQALQMIYRQNSSGYRHAYAEHYQLLDVDLTGLVAGRQAEQATKGYFSGRKNRRGRQLGRVLATHYDEIVFEKLYPGTVQLEQNLQELLCGAEAVLELDETRRKRTIVRVDGGGGRDADINWLLSHGYFILAKTKNWKRSCKLAKSVRVWFPDPKVPDRQMGWVEAPHSYDHPTRQLAIRWPKANGQWHYRVLVSNLTDEMLFELAHLPIPDHTTQAELLTAFVTAYDLRGGGVETTFKSSKAGLGLHKRNKRSFAAQEMLVFLAQLAYNLISWVRNLLAKVSPTFQHFGILRMVRDVFHISGKVQLTSSGQIKTLVLNKGHTLAQPFLEALQLTMALNGVRLILRQI